MKRNNLQMGSGCMTLFALPFAAIGVFMTVWAAGSIRDAYRMSQWQETPATIVTADLRTSHDSDGGNTHEAKATYRYEVSGSVYTGNRVSIHSGGDNIGGFQRRAYQELKQHQESGRPFRCYVNPHDPADSILYRDPRWEMIGFKALFGLVFGGVGFGLLAAGVCGRRRLRAENAAKARRPDEPWLWNPNWAAGVVKSSNKTEMRAAMFFAAFWNAISFPIAAVFISDKARHEPLAYLVLIFPLVGLALAVWAVKTVLRYRTFGTSTFRMTQMPGVIGGPVQGVVEVPVHIRPVDDFRVALRCVRRFTSGDNTSEEVMWEDVRLIAHELSQGVSSHTAIPIQFAVPRSCRPTESGNPGDQIVWRLEVDAATHGLRYQSRFEIPVFVTPASSADFQPDTSFTTRYEKKIDPLQVLRENSIIVRPIPGGISYTFPAARHKGSAAMLTLFFAIWTGVVVVLFRVNAPRIFPVVLGLIDAGVLWGVLVAWFQWRRVEIGLRSVVLSNGMIVGTSRREVRREDVADVVATMSSQQGSQTFFRLKLQTKSGRSHTLGAGIAGRYAADRIAGEIKRAIAGR